MGQKSRGTSSANARRESTGRQDIAVSGSPEDAASALMVRADGDEFRGNDALFQALLNGANVPCAAQMSGISERNLTQTPYLPHDVRCIVMIQNVNFVSALIGITNKPFFIELLLNQFPVNWRYNFFLFLHFYYL